MYLDSGHGIFFVRGQWQKYRFAIFIMLRDVHDMFSTCLRYILNMFTTCSQHVLKMFTTCHEHVMNVSWTWHEHGIAGYIYMHKQCCNSHVYRPTFWARSNGQVFESLRPLQVRHGGLHVSRFRARKLPVISNYKSRQIVNLGTK